MKLQVIIIVSSSLVFLLVSAVSTNTVSEKGEKLFSDYCAVCHLPAQVLAGPPITFISDFKDLEWFIDYKSDPLKYSKSDIDTYTSNMLEYWIPTMAIEPPSNLSTTELTEIYLYLEELKLVTAPNEKIDSLRLTWLE
ncbi:MAG: hypothetical protein AB8B53_04530 [Flavobacteriales bacterium]